MNKSVNVVLEWAPVSEGGRKVILPPQMRYCPIIYSKDIPSDKTLWSVAVINQTLDDRKSTAEMYFMSSEAPHDLLKTGLVFDLFDGPNKVASGKIV